LTFFWIEAGTLDTFNANTILFANSDQYSTTKELLVAEYPEYPEIEPV
jgi:hypothetical protein